MAPVQAVQQALFATHVVVPGQFLNPLAQAMAQSVPSQVALPFDGGLAQAEHRAPHEATAVLDRQDVPLHAWVPEGQLPSHGAVVAMQAPLHNRWPLGHVAEQATPLQLVVPPVGTAHAVQDVAPQLAVKRLSTQRPPHE